MGNTICPAIQLLSLHRKVSNIIVGELCNLDGLLEMVCYTRMTDIAD